MLGDEDKSVQVKEKQEFVDDFLLNYFPEPGFEAKYVIVIPELNKSITIEAKEDKVKCFYSTDTEGNVVMKASASILRQIIAGKMTFQKGFMAGEITAKGNFKTLRMLDQIFRFRYKR